MVLAPLAVLALVALAGCAHPAGMMRMEPVNEDELAERASRATTGADRYPAIYEQRLARRVIENGSLTVIAGRPLLEGELPYRHRGRYYDLSYTALERVPGATTLVRVDYNATPEGEGEGERVAFADLPEADRARLDPLFANPPSIRRNGPEATLPLYYPGPAGANSTLLDHEGETLVVTYRGEAYAVEVARVKEGPLWRFRYRATLVAESTRAYAGHLKRTYGFRLSNLSDRETSVVRSAIEDGYYPSSTDDRGFASLLQRFRAHRAIEAGEYSGSWLVRYRGSYYWVEMEFGAFLQDETPTTDTPVVTPH